MYILYYDDGDAVEHIAVADSIEKLKDCKQLRAKIETLSDELKIGWREIDRIDRPDLDKCLWAADYGVWSTFIIAEIEMAE